MKSDSIHFISKPILGGAELIACKIADNTNSAVISIFRFTSTKVGEVNIYGLLYFFRNMLFVKKTFCHTPASYLFVYFFYIFRRFEIVYVLHSRLNLIKKYINFIGFISQKKKIICVSQSVFNEASKRFPLSNIKLIPNIPLHINHEDKKRSDAQNTRFIYIGRLSDEKGIIEFIKFLKINNKKESLEIIGEGDLKQLERIKNINYRNITFHGWKKNPYSDITKKDVIVIPSKSESYSLVLHEAIHLGIRTYIFDGSLLVNLSEDGKENTVLVNSYDEIYMHLQKKPVNNLSSKDINYDEMLNNWIMEYIKI